MLHQVRFANDINRGFGFCNTDNNLSTTFPSPGSLITSAPAMVDSSSLTTLTPREAVADALHRCVLGIDNNDHDLFESACLTNENMIWIGGGYEIQGWTAIKKLFDKVFNLVTTHAVSNIRVQLEDNQSSASLTAHAISYHVRPEDALKLEDTSYTASSLYNINLVQGEDDGLWKIKRWEANILWTTGDRTILHS